MDARKVQFIALAACVASLVVLPFVLEKEPPVISPPADFTPTPADIYAEAMRKAKEYAEAYIVPHVERPIAARVVVVYTHLAETIDGVEWWEGTGRLEFQGNDGTFEKTPPSNWRITFAYADRNFFCVSAMLDGTKVPVPPSRYADVFGHSANRAGP
jgi:hypothetical protein